MYGIAESLCAHALSLLGTSTNSYADNVIYDFSLSAMCPVKLATDTITKVSLEIYSTY